MRDIQDILLSPDESIQQAMERITNDARRIALVVDDAGRLLTTVTDGDIRRAILDHIALDAPVTALMPYKAERYQTPITAPQHTPKATLQRMMHQHQILHIPLVDDEGRVIDCVTLNDVLPAERTLPLQGVVMAGGLGTRLHPLTKDTPKPMLPVGGRPLLEHILDSFEKSGIRQVNISTFFQAEKIKDHFGDGRAFGVDINYVTEDQPLGTAGALGLLDPPSEPLLVINGDILTRVDFRAMLEYHEHHHAQLTVGVRQYQMRVPYGVVVSEAGQVRELQEKPSYTFMVNAGIYIISPDALRHIPSQERFDMTDLVRVLLEDDQTVVSFPIIEYWLDIGQPIDYEQAQNDYDTGKLE